MLNKSKFVNAVAFFAFSLSVTPVNASKHAIYDGHETRTAVSVSTTASAQVSAVAGAGVEASKAVSISSPTAEHRVRIVVADPALLGSAASILDNSGTILQEFSLRHVNHVDVRNWPSGTYMLRLINGQMLPINCR